MCLGKAVTELVAEGPIVGRRERGHRVAIGRGTHRCWGKEENQNRARKSSKISSWATAECDFTITKTVKVKEKAAGFDERQWCTFTCVFVR